MLFICTKINNIVVALLVLLVFETTSKKLQTPSPYEQSCCYHALRTRKKLQNPPPYKQSCCYHALGTKKKFLRRPQEITQAFHILMLYLFVR